MYPIQANPRTMLAEDLAAIMSIAGKPQAKVA